MRILIYLLTAIVVGIGLFLFDDVDIGLSVVNIVVWLAVAVVGIVLVLRNRLARGTGHRRRRPSRREARPLIARSAETPISARPEIRQITRR